MTNVYFISERLEKKEDKKMKTKTLNKEQENSLTAATGMCYMNNSTNNHTKGNNMNQIILLTPKEVADFFQIKVETVYQWKFYNKIKSVKVNGKLLFRQDDILEMVG